MAAMPVARITSMSLLSPDLATPTCNHLSVNLSRQHNHNVIFLDKTPEPRNYASRGSA